MTFDSPSPCHLGCKKVVSDPTFPVYGQGVVVDSGTFFVTT